MKTRNCAWMPKEEVDRSRVVWGRAGIFTTHCPKSLITAESLCFLDGYRILKAWGTIDWSMLPARCAEAYLVLEQASKKEKEHGDI